MPIDPKLLQQLITRQETPENPIPLDIPLSYDKSRYVTPDKVTSYYGMGDLSAYTKYGVPIYPWIPLDDWRAKNQSRQQQWGRAMVNTGNELVIGSLKGISDVPKMAKAFLGKEGIAAMADAEAHKDALTAFYDKVKDNNQIYLEADEKGFKPGKATWWAQGLPSTASAVSMLVPTIGAAKGVTYASKLLGSLSKAKAVTTGLKAVGLAEDALFFGKQGTALAATVGGALYGNAYESYLEMSQMLPQFKQQLIDSGKYSAEEIDAILQQEGEKIYKKNLPNAALDMFGIYTLLKPSTGIRNLISTNTGKRVLNTLKMEAIPEGVQEGRNAFVSSLAQSDIDKLTGLRAEDDNYDFNEFINSEDSWTSMAFGAIGGALFMGAGNMFRQVGENIDDKANVFRGVGAAAVSGLTTSEAKLAETQKTMLDGLKAETGKLLQLRSFAELAGNADLYNKLTDRLTTASAISHMAVGTYDAYLTNLQTVGQVLDGLEKELTSQENVDEQSLAEITSLKESHAKALKNTESAARYYVKGTSFYGLNSAENNRYVNSSIELDEKTSELNSLVGLKQSLFAQDEFGVLRSKRSKQVSELLDARTNLENELATLSNYSTDTAEAGKRNIIQAMSEVEQRIEALRNSKDIDAISELAIAEKSLEVAKAKTAVIEVLDGTYTKKVKSKLAYIEKDPVLGKFVYGKDGIVDSLGNAIANASLSELRYNAANKQIEDAEDINVRQSLDELAKNNTGLSTESRNKLLAKVDAEMQEVRNSEEAAAIAEVDNNTEAYEQLGVFRDSDDIIQDMLNTQIGTEAYNKIQKEIEARLGELNELKKAITAIPDFTENTLSKEEIINEHIRNEINTITETLDYIREAEEDSPELVGSLIAYLENLKKFIQNPVEFEVTGDFISDIDIVLEKAKEISNEIYDRLKQQDLQQEKKYNSFFGSLVIALKIALPDFEGTTLKDIQDAVNVIRKDSVKFKKVKEDISVALEGIEKELARLGFKGQAYTRGALKFSPITSIFTLASEGKFLTPEFRVTLQSKDLKPEGKNLSALELMERAIPYSALLRLIDNSIAFDDVLTAEQKLNTPTSPSLFPEQRAALYEFITAFGAGRRAFYLQGVAGAGKTTVALGAFLKTLITLGKLKQEQIFVMAKGTAVNNKVNKEVKGTGSEIEWFNNQVLDKARLLDSLKDKTFLVIDEIGKLSGKEYSQLYEVIDEINKTRTTDKLSILMTGDPNQMTGVSTIPTLDSHMHSSYSRSGSTTVLPTLTISQRTNNARVISFQNRFLKAGKENVFNDVFNESHSPDHTQGVAISTSVKEFRELLTRKVREGNDVALIVETRAQVQEYSKIAGLRVYTVSDSQGLDFDEVFIDLQTYSPFTKVGGIESFDRFQRDNKIFYTAISRAKNYVNLFSSSTNGISEINLPEDQFAKEYKAKKFKDNADDYTAHLTNELKAFGKTPAVTKQETKEVVAEEQELEEETESEVIPEVTNDESPTEDIGDNKPIPTPKEIRTRTSKSKDVNPAYAGIKQSKVGDKVMTFRRKSLIPDIEEIVYVLEKDGKLIEVANRHVPESSEIIAPFAHTYTVEAIEELKAQGMQTGTATISNQAALSYNYNDTAESLDDKFFDRIKSTFADFFKSENYVFTPSSIATHIFVATDANIAIENKVLEQNKSSLRIGKEGTPFTVIPGASYMRVEGTATHATNGTTKKQIQYIPLEPKKLTTSSPDLVTLQSLVKNTTEVEPLLSSLGFNYRYGRNAEVEVNIRGKAIKSNEFEVFLNALRFTTDSAGNALTYSPMDKVLELFTKINSLPAEQKVLILDKLNAINNLLYTTTRTDLVRLTNAELIKDSNNEFLTLSGTGVNALPYSSLKGLSSNIFNAAKQAGYEIISRQSTKDSPVELRKTFEIAGTSEGKAVVYHVKVSIPLTKTTGGFLFEENVVPRIEIFEQDFIDYQKYTQDKNNPELKAKAVKRIRKHFLPDMPKRTNRIYNSTQGQLVDFGLIGQNIFNVDLEATMVDFLTNGFAKVEPGPAQLAINRIAQNNRKVYIDNDGSGRFHSLQRFHTYPDAKGQYITSVTGLSLTSAKTDLNNTYVVTKVINPVTKQAETKYLVKQGEDFIEAAHGDQFELADMLPLLFQFNNGVSSTNGGFGLRETTFSRQVSLINKPDTLLNKEKRAVKQNALSKYESSFKSINETFIEFDEEVGEETTSTPQTPGIVIPTTTSNPIDKVKALMATEPAKALALIFDLQTVYTSGKEAKELEDLLNQLTKEDKLESADDDDIDSLTKDNGIPNSNPLSRKEVIALVKSLVPDITEEELMVMANEIVTNDGKKLSNNLGAVYQGVIYLLESKDATVDEQVVRHEVFHKIFGQYVPLTTRMKITEAARNTKAFAEWMNSRGITNATDSQVNEFLAEAFQKYRLGKSSKNNIFTKLFNFLERIFIGIKKLYSRDAVLIDKLFLDIVSQKYVTKDIPNPETPSAFLKQVEDYFPEDSVRESLASYMMAVNIIKSFIDKYRGNKGEITFNETLGVYEGFKTDQVESIKQVAAAIRKELQVELSKIGIVGNEFVALFNLNRKELRPEINRIRKSSERAAILLHLKNPETVKQIVIELEGNSAESYLKALVDELKISAEDTLGDGDNFTNEVKAGGLYDEIVSNLNVNNALTLTSKVKQALTLIKVDGKYLTFRFAYAKLLDLFINKIDVRGNVLEQILKESKTADPKTLGVLNFLKEIYEVSHEKKVVVGKARIDIPNGFEYSNNTFSYKGLEIGRAETAKEYYDKVITELQEYKDPYLTEYFRRAGISSPLDFYNFLKKVEMQGEAADLYRQIAHRIASQVQNDPLVDLVDVRETRRYNTQTNSYDYTYETYLKASKISPAGIQSNIKQSLQYGIEDLLLKFKNNPESVSIMLKNQNINNILNAFGMPKYVINGINDGDAAKVKDALDTIIKGLPTDAAQLDRYLESIGDKNLKVLDTLSRLLSKSNDFLAALNYIDSRNNSRYIFVTGSWLYDTLTNLIEGVGRMPEFLRADNYIARHNIFGKSKLQTIYDVTAIDGLAKTINRRKDEYPSIKYQNFSPADFFQHRFYHGFLSVVNRSEVNPTYYQYTYIQSDRKSDVAAKIKVLNFKELKAAYQSLLEFEADRAELIKSKAFKVANFNGYKSKVNPTFEGFLKEMRTKSKKDFLLMMEELINSNNFQASVERLPQVSETITQLRALNLVYPALEKELRADVRENIMQLMPEKTKAKPEDYEQLYVAFYGFYLQNYINGEFLNQLAFGDKAFAKSNTDLTKRMQGVQSPGDRQLIDPVIGNKRYSKAVVASDYIKSMGLVEDVKKIFQKLYRADINSTDAVTLVTPHTMKNIRKGTGNYHLQGHVKPVAFYVDSRTGITHYIKTAAFEITNELAYAFPQMSELRKQMESHGLTEVQKEQYNAIYDKVISNTATPFELFTYDKLIENSIEYYIFESAYKVGRPLDLVQNGEAIQDKHVITIDNQYFRIQGDPLSDSTDISNTTQFNYFTNTNGLNEVEAFQLYNLDAELMRQKFNLYNHKKRILNPDGTVNKDKVRAVIKASLAKSPQDERMWDLLNNKVDINFPSIVNRAVIGIASKHAKESVEIRHSGKKLVVQSALGITLYQLGKNILTFNELSSKDRFKARTFENLSYNLKQALIQVADIYSTDTFLLDNSRVSSKEYIQNKSFATYLATKHSLTEAEVTAFNEYVDLLLSSPEDLTILIPRRLKMRDENNYTEVIVPAWWAKQLPKEVQERIKNNEIFSKFNTGMAVRIPTTGIHSSIPVKIIVSTDTAINRIIAPEELVALHGSDFDVDSLFFMNREVATEEDLKGRSLKFGEYTVKAGYLVGYDSEGNLDREFYNSLVKAIDAAPDLVNDKPNRYKESLISLRIKYVLNSKVDNNLDLITADKNQRDMNTPISFEPFKLDPFRNFTLIDLVDSNKSLDEILAKNLKEMPDEIKDLFKNRKASSFIDADEFANGKLVIIDTKLKQDLLESNIGLETKLKIIYEKQDLKQDRDINTVGDQMRFHQDNFGGKMGVGIQANAMKVLAYLMYGGKFKFNGKNLLLSRVIDMQYGKDGEVTIIHRDGEGNVVEETGKLDRPKVKLRKVKTVVIDGEKLFDYEDLNFKHITLGSTEANTHEYLERLTKSKEHYVFELLDTIINGYIDNVKEQVTSVINANTLTIDSIAFLIGIGFEFDSIGYLMNQPIIRDVTKSKLTYTTRVREAKRLLFAKLKTIDPNKAEEIDSSNYEFITSDKTNLDILNKFKDMPFSQMVKQELTADEIISQLAALSLLEKAKSTTASFFPINRVLKLLQSFPVNTDEMSKTEEAIKYIKDGRLPFESDNLLQIPHISEAISQFESMYDIVKQSIYLTNPAVQSVLAEIKDNTNFSTKSRPSPINYAETMKELTDQFQGFLLNYLIEREDITGYFDSIKEYVGIDNATGQLVKKASGDKLQYKVNRRTKEDGKWVKKEIILEKSAVTTDLLPEELWIQQFILDIQELRQDVNNELNTNTFFTSFVPSRPKNSQTYVLKYTKGSGADIGVDAQMRKGFLDMPAELQKKFTVYAILQDRGKFGFDKFTNFIPSTETSADLNNIKLASDLYVNEVVNRLLVPKTDAKEEAIRNAKLKNILEYFEYDLVRISSTLVRNPFANNKEDLIDKDTAKKILKDTRYDPDSAKVYKGGSHPKWFVDRTKHTETNTPAIYMTVDIISYDKKLYTIYKMVGKQTASSVFKYNSYWEDHSFAEYIKSRDRIQSLPPKALEEFVANGVHEYEVTYNTIHEVKELYNLPVDIPYKGDFIKGYANVRIKAIKEGTTKRTRTEEGENKEKLEIETTIPLFTYTVKYSFSKTPEIIDNNETTDNSSEVPFCTK